MIRDHLPSVDGLLQGLEPDGGFVLLILVRIVVERCDGGTNGLDRRRRIHLRASVDLIHRQPL